MIFKICKDYAFLVYKIFIISKAGRFFEWVLRDFMSVHVCKHSLIPGIGVWGRKDSLFQK
jgi:hypothetical protein